MTGMENNRQREKESHAPRATGWYNDNVILLSPIATFFPYFENYLRGVHLLDLMDQTTNRSG